MSRAAGPPRCPPRSPPRLHQRRDGPQCAGSASGVGESGCCKCNRVHRRGHRSKGAHSGSLISCSHEARGLPAAPARTGFYGSTLLPWCCKCRSWRRRRRAAARIGGNGSDLHDALLGGTDDEANQGQWAAGACVVAFCSFVTPPPLPSRSLRTARLRRNPAGAVCENVVCAVPVCLMEQEREVGGLCKHRPEMWEPHKQAMRTQHHQAESRACGGERGEGRRGSGVPRNQSASRMHGSDRIVSDTLTIGPPPSLQLTSMRAQPPWRPCLFPARSSSRCPWSCRPALPSAQSSLAPCPHRLSPTRRRHRRLALRPPWAACSARPRPHRPAATVDTAATAATGAARRPWEWAAA